jgi:hypothetical protein
VPGVPTMVIDGVSTVGGGARENAPKNYSDYTTKIEKELDTAAKGAVTVGAAWDGQKIKVTATADQLPADAKSLTLHIVLAEHELRFTGENGVRFHSMVVRGVGGADGKAGEGFPIASVAGKTTVDYTFDLAAIKDDVTKTIAAEIKRRREMPTVIAQTEAGNRPEYRAEDHAMTDIDPNALVVVAYVQDADKHILQAAQFAVPGLTGASAKKK